MEKYTSKELAEMLQKSIDDFENFNPHMTSPFSIPVGYKPEPVSRKSMRVPTNTTYNGSKLKEFRRNNGYSQR